MKMKALRWGHSGGNDSFETTTIYLKCLFVVGGEAAILLSYLSCKHHVSGSLSLQRVDAYLLFVIFFTQTLSVVSVTNKRYGSMVICHDVK